jgi:hypothetical protein
MGSVHIETSGAKTSHAKRWFAYFMVPEGKSCAKNTGVSVLMRFGTRKEGSPRAALE